MFGLSKKICPKLWPWWRTSLTFWVVLFHIGHKTWSDWAFYHRYSPLEMAMMRGPRTLAMTLMVMTMSVFKSIRAAGMRPPIHREFHSHSFVSLPSPPPTSATFTCLDVHRFQPFSSSILLFLFLHLSSFSSSFILQLLPPSLAQMPTPFNLFLHLSSFSSFFWPPPYHLL